MWCTDELGLGHSFSCDKQLPIGLVHQQNTYQKLWNECVFVAQVLYCRLNNQLLVLILLQVYVWCYLGITSLHLMLPRHYKFTSDATMYLGITSLHLMLPRHYKFTSDATLLTLLYMASLGCNKSARGMGGRHAPYTSCSLGTLYMYICCVHLFVHLRYLCVWCNC